MPSFFRHASIVNQLATIVLLIVFAVFTALSIFVNHEVDKGFIKNVEHSLDQQVDQLAQNIDFFNETLKQQTNQIADVFIQMFPGDMLIDELNQVEVGEFTVPTLLHDYETVTRNFSKPDQFTNMTGGTATIFMRVKDDFLRVSTSLRKTDGSRAFGTMLGKKHPGYQKLINGEEYSGPAHLFGRDYMTKYIPFKDTQGKVIGILYVGFDYTERLAALQKTISDLKIGETGFAYIVNLKQGPQFGQLLLHPFAKGKNLTEVSESGNTLLNTISSNDHGFTHIPFTHEDGNIKDKLIAYSQVSSFNWAIVAGAATEEFLTESEKLRVEMILLSVFCALLIAGLLFFTLKVKLQPIDTICNYMQAIGQGDLTTRIDTDMGDDENTHNEIHKLSRSAKKTIAGLRKVTGELNTTMHTIQNHLGTVSSGIDRLNIDINRQQQETEMVAAAISEMTSTSEEVARNAATTAEQTQRANSEASHGDELVQEVVGSIQGISCEVNELTNMIEQVEENSNAIGTVMDVIQNIAEQTNLLALNAAIEAARAGEAGRGFSVVADEVRNLAQQTATSTTEIREMIERLQGNTRNAVDRMEQSNTKVQNSVEMTSQAGHALTSITDSVANISDASAQIASAAEEQTSVSEDISRNVESISTIAQETANSSQQMNAAINELGNAGQELKRVIALFKV
ncbi:methyl-accepting chemotaxis protein [Neptuniibacter sp. QD48_11]|uniref:methyl-accepting chemotaxis protein n=1 Tax=unclassified Neptuniibacter TaxID=2630693 RepID=UPI0039F5B2FE